MVAYSKFQNFVERLAEGGIDMDTSTIKLALSNTAPNAATNAVIGDITQIANGNGYTTGGITLTLSSSAQSGGTYSYKVNDITAAWTASGGSIGPFQYFILYDSTTTNLIGFWDNGSTITLASGDALNLDFDNTNGLFTIT
jgi:hypothetical protein